MSNELAVISAVQGVTSTVTSLVSTFSVLRTLRKGDVKKLREQIEFTRVCVKSQHMNTLVLLNVEQISEVVNRIQSYNLGPVALGMAIQHLENLNQALIQNFNDFRNWGRTGY